MSFHRPRRFQIPIFIFDDVACDKQDAIREHFAMDRTREHQLFLSLSDVCKDTEVSYT